MFASFLVLAGDGGGRSSEIPPHSLLFSVTPNALAFLKTPSVSISLSNVLKDILKYSYKGMFCRELGIDLDKWFRDMSKSRRLLIDAKEDGTILSKDFPSKKRYSNIMHSPIVLGM